MESKSNPQTKGETMSKSKTAKLQKVHYTVATDEHIRQNLVTVNLSDFFTDKAGVAKIWLRRYGTLEGSSERESFYERAADLMTPGIPNHK